MQTTTDTTSAAKPTRAAKTKSKKNKGAVAPDLGTMKMPTTSEELLEAIARTVFDEVQQPTRTDAKKTRRQNYAAPWAGYSTWHEGRDILKYYETNAVDGVVGFDPFNGSWNNSAQMSVAVDPVKTAIEVGTNMHDAENSLGAKCAGDDPRDEGAPQSPREAAARYFDVQPTDLMDLDVIKAKKLNDWAKENLVIRVFAGEHGSGDSCVVDFVDSGIGIEPTDEAWRGSILSLNRENKRAIPWAIGKHGWGAGGAFQNADLSFLGSALPDGEHVAFTIVEKFFRNSWDKVPTFQFLTVDGKIPVVKRPKWWKWSTMVRHIGFRAPFTSLSGENSLLAQLDRHLPEPVLPIWTEVVWMRDGELQGAPTLPGHLRPGRLLRGTMNKCRDSWQRTQRGEFEGKSVAEKAKNELSRVRFYDDYFIDLGDYDFGGREGVSPAGTVTVHFYVLDVKKDYTYKTFVDPKKPVLFVLDGQTHGEHFASMIGSTSHGAGLSYVAKRAVCIVKCDGLTRESKFVLFGSSREQMRQNGLFKRMVEEIIGRLKSDQSLTAVNLEMAAESRKDLPIKSDDDFVEALEKYLDKQDLKFTTLQRKRTRSVTEWQDAEREVETGRREPKKPTPIPSNIPPTILRWAIKRPSVKMWPGQRYSFVLETDAPPDWYQPDDPAKSKIQVMGMTVHFRGSDRPKGGRIRCYFECPDTCKPGQKGLIHAQLTFPRGEFSPLQAQLNVEIVEKPKKRTRTDGDGKGGGTGKGGKKRKETVSVQVRVSKTVTENVPLLPAIPITLTEHPDRWAELAWDRDDTASFSVTWDGVEAAVFYNPQNRWLVESRDALVKKHADMEDRFDQLFRLKLVLEAIFCLNHGYYQDTSTDRDLVRQVQKVNEATMRSLAMDVKTEIEQQVEVETLRANAAP